MSRNTFTRRQEAAILAALRLMQDAVDEREGISIISSLWADYYDLLTDGGELVPLNYSEFDALCEQFSRGGGVENGTIFRAEGDHTWTFVICPGRGFVEQTLEQNNTPAGELPDIHPASLAGLREFCRQGYRPFVYQYEYEDSLDIYDVYYATDALAGRRREPERRFVIGETHTYIRTIRASNPDDVYRRMQGLNWSPNGEVVPYIEVLEGIHHTSMSAGDVVLDPTAGAWMCVFEGWRQVEMDNELDGPFSHVSVEEGGGA